MSNIQVSKKKELCDIEKDVISILESNKITMGCHYIGESKMNSDDKNLMDKFVVTFKDSDTGMIESFDFYKGFGNRKTSKNLWTKTVVYKPSEAEVLHCLVSDLYFGEMSFREFCDELGYNYDSIKDLSLHRKMEGQAVKMRKIFKCIERLQVALQDY